MLESRDALRQAWGEENFVGGSLCLDFANTANLSGHAEDRLTSYPALTHWAVAAGSLAPEDKAALDAQAAADPKAAQAALSEALALRAALHALFDSLSHGAAPDDPAALEGLDAAGRRARAAQRLLAGPDGFALGWPDIGTLAGAERLARPLWPVALSALDLLTDREALALTRQCASDDCSWLFVDTTKNHRRRWCDMATCGNRAKARRHYTRRRDEPHAT